MTPEEKAVIEAAITAHQIGREPSVAESTILRQAVHELIFACPECNTDRHTCPGCGDNIGHTETMCLCCEREQLPYEVPINEEPQWYPRTYADVCTGDTIRHTPTAPPAKVLSCSIEARHVKNGGTGKHWDDTAVEHMLTRVRLDYPGNETPDRIFDIPSALPVEILLTAEEFRAIELLGWGNRL